MSSVTEVTSLSTVISTLDSSTVTSISTFTSSSIVITSIPDSTTTELPPTTSSSVEVPPTSSESIITSTFTPPSTAPTQETSFIVVTSTLPPSTRETSTRTSSSSSSLSSSSSPSALSAAGDGNGNGGGLDPSATIAIAVVIPVVVVAALVVFGLWFWRKRKARKSNEELRKSEMADYGFNPNSDPTLAPVGAAYADDASDAPEDNSGYRGWGATSSNRKASTTLGSNGRAGGLAVSDTGSQPGGYGYQGSSPATNPSDAYSADPLMHTHPEHGDGVGALGAGATAGVAAGGLARHQSGNGGIRRGPSNASSSYSNGAPQSEASSDVPGVPAHYYEQEVPYNEYNNQGNMGGPYGDGSYGGTNGQPVIRDVQARRNTRIERAPTFPQTQGGIAQNF